ncbi:hypothetical protein Poli38472_007905 [Pythium oligandrum]|uniref:Cyclic nucleotide-binding domain-containing protein n=1 Tax=Pythium oligandrum TaxID=41045 RepID=A0A8K1FS55_PYTOL|nr:hypothetical protein Poli38472_007905 [Pythium oligandrum]|eukprot:TMW68233.1 hypothetical protein Poli38472_007905 [Pythium oligandrum]
MSWASFLHALWLARVIRVTKDVWLRLLYNRFSYVLSLLRLVLLLALTTHYTACFWRLVQLLDHGDAVDIHDGGVWDTYMTDVYYAVQLLQGHGGVARTTRDHVFSSVAVLIGILVLATLSGSLAVLIFNYYSNSSSYQRKLESVFAKMDKLHLPPSLRARIHQYYDHLWFEHDSLNGEIAQFTRELSPSLALEVRLFKYMDLVLRVPLWRDCSTDFVTQIMLRLNVRAYLPEDYVIRQGEIGEELFLLNRGICELRACSGTSTGVSDPLIPLHHRPPSTITTEGGGGGQNINVRRLMPGHAFGELALLMNYKRSATVRALTFVEMCLLSRQAFQEILLRYREDRGKVLKELVLSCIDMRDKRFIPFPWEELIERANAKTPATGISAHTRLSPEEAADRIVDFINPPERTDTSITFGFRDLDIVSGFQLLPVVPLGKNSPAYRDPSLDGSHSELKTHVELIANRQEQTLERLATLERTVTALVAEIRQSSI